MRNALIVFVLSLCAALASCSATRPTNQTTQNTAHILATPLPQANVATNATNQSLPLEVAPAHSSSNANASGGTSVPGKAPVATPELDAKIDKALAKAKAPGASLSDKKAAAAAYLARGNFYWSAGDVRLYRFALGDFRRVLHYDPANTEAQSKIDELVRIYQSLGRPVPDIGTEQ